MRMDKTKRDILISLGMGSIAILLWIVKFGLDRVIYVVTHEFTIGMIICSIFFWIWMKWFIRFMEWIMGDE